MGPGASSFMASAAQLEAVADGILALLAGDLATAAALGITWPSPTGAVAVAANLPHVAWLASSAAMLSEHAAKIAATGTAFETLKAATPTPAEVELNQATHMLLEATNFLGINTPAIIANRAQYFGDYWVRAASNKYSYAAASASGVQSIEPLPPPVPTSIPMGGGGIDPGSSSQTGGGDPTSAMQAPMQMMTGLVGQIGQVGGQLGQLASGGGALQGLTQLPQQAMSPLMSLSSGMGAFGQPGAGALDGAGAGSWIGAAPSVGGPVSASLSAGAAGIGGGVGGGLSGGGGIGGFGGGAASVALRGPVSWSSIPTGAPSESAAPTARLVDGTTTATTTTTPAAMGSGAMVAPLAARAATGEDKHEAEQHAAVLTWMAGLYRAPVAVPVVTGGSGAVFRGEGAGQN